MFKQLADAFSARLRNPATQFLWSRAAVLFVLLLGLKVALVFVLREDVFQTQWRILEPEESPLAAMNRYLFVALVVASLFLLGSRSAGFENSTIRRLNLSFVLLGCVFAFFSLEKLELNYVFPTLLGWLSYREVGDYLYQDAFFARPFFAYFLATYLLGYGVLRLMKRESWSFHLLGLLALVYGLMQLQDLRRFGPELIVANVFGIVSLWSAWRRCPPLGNGWIVLLVALGAGALQIFQPNLVSDEISVRYMRFFCALTMTGLLVCWPLLRWSVAFASVSHWVPFYFVSCFLLGNRSYPIASNLNHIFVYALSAAHYLTQEVIALAVLIGLALWVARWSPKWARWCFTATAGLLLLIGVLDLELSRRTGNRLDWHAMTMSDDPVLLWRMLRAQAVPVFTGLALLWIVFWSASKLSRMWLAAGHEARSGSRPTSFAYIVAAMALMALASRWLVENDKGFGSPAVNLVASSPVAGFFDRARLAPDQFIQQSRELGIKDYTADIRKEPRQKELLNVVLIILESTYNKHLSLFGSADQTQPLLSKYRDRMELFPNYYAPFPNSLHARFAILNGLYSTVEYVSYLNPRIPAPSLFEILKDHGYVNSLFYSSFRNYTRFNDYVGHRKLDYFFDCTSMPGREKFRSVVWGVEESCTLEAMKDQLARHASQGERFCLTYIPAAPHFPYDISEKRFQIFADGRTLPGEDYTGAYRNGLLYMDWIVSSLIGELSELKLLDQTLVVITGDHGEMTGGADRFLGHGWSLDPQLCNVPLILMDPRQRGFRINTVPGCHVDLLPTIAELLGIELPAQQLYQGVSLVDRAAAESRQIYLTSVAQRALIRSNIFILDDPDHRRNRVPNAVQGFEIQVDGTRTAFVPFECEKSTALASMDRFPRLQRSLIRHYETYRNAVRSLHEKPVESPARQEKE